MQLIAKARKGLNQTQHRWLGVSIGTDSQIHRGAQVPKCKIQEAYSVASSTCVRSPKNQQPVFTAVDLSLLVINFTAKAITREYLVF